LIAFFSENQTEIEVLKIKNSELEKIKYVSDYNSKQLEMNNTKKIQILLVSLLQTLLFTTRFGGPKTN